MSSPRASLQTVLSQTVKHAEARLSLQALRDAVVHAAWTVGIPAFCWSFGMLYTSFFWVVRSSAPLGMTMWSFGALLYGACAVALVRRLTGQRRSLLQHSYLFVISAMIMCVSNNVAYYFHTPGPALFDVGFSIMPEPPQGSILWHGNGILAAGAFVALCMRALLSQNTQMVIDWLRLMAVVYFTRTCTVWNTSLPGPASHCSYDSPEYNPPTTFLDIISRMGGLYGQDKGCGDLLFSGHTAWVVVTLAVHLNYLPNKPALRRAARVLSALYLAAFVSCVLCARRHYTADVVFGIIIGNFVAWRFKDGWTMERRGLDRYEYLAGRKNSSDDTMLELPPAPPQRPWHAV